MRKMQKSEREITHKSHLFFQNGTVKFNQNKEGNLVSIELENISDEVKVLSDRIFTIYHTPMPVSLPETPNPQPGQAIPHYDVDEYFHRSVTLGPERDKRLLLAMFTSTLMIVGTLTTLAVPINDAFAGFLYTAGLAIIIATWLYSVVKYAEIDELYSAPHKVKQGNSKY